MMKYVVIGNSAAGIAAVEEIRKNDSEGKITVISDEPYKTYSRPLISYYLKGKVKDENMYYRDSDFYEKLNVETVFGKKATKIDEKAKKVYCGKESYEYDKLLIATGSVPFVPPVEGAQGRDNVYTFLKWDDAKALGQAIKKDSKVVVIGGGLIGLKAAEGAHHYTDNVTVVELSDRVLATILDSVAGEMISKKLEQNNISCILGDTGVEFDGKKLTLKSGKILDCDILIIAVGVRANDSLAREIGIETGRGIICNECQETSIKDIYAAGDVAESYDVTDGKRKILALLPDAVKQGKVAGSQMSGGDKKYVGGYPMNAIDFFGDYITTCGVINPPEGEGYEVRVEKDDNSYKKMVTKDNLLAGYILINQPNLSGILTNMVSDKVALDSLEGDIFESFGLMSYNAPTRYKKLHGGDAQ